MTSDKRLITQGQRIKRSIAIAVVVFILLQGLYVYFVPDLFLVIRLFVVQSVHLIAWKVGILDMRPEFDSQIFLGWWQAVKAAFNNGILIKIIASALLGYLYFHLKNKSIDYLKKAGYSRGSELVDANTLSKIIRQDGAEKYHVADIPIPKGKQNRGIAFFGAPGSGKSTSMKKLMSEVRENNQPMLVFDSKPEFTSVLYRAEETVLKNNEVIPPDILLTPFDERSHIISILDTIIYDTDFSNIAHIIIPDNGRQDENAFFVNSARIILECIMRALVRHKNMRSNRHLYYYANVASYEELKILLAGTEAINRMASKREFSSVRNTMANHTDIFKYLICDKPIFNIREWVKSYPKNAVIMLTRHEVNSVTRKLFKIIINTYMSAVLSLPSKEARSDGKDTEHWMFLDEITDLGKVEKLKNYVKNCRSVGGCVVTGVQDLTLIDDLYGRESAQSLRGLFQTWVVFRQGDESSAVRLSEAFGQQETEEERENTSVSYSPAGEKTTQITKIKDKKTSTLVLSSEVTRLNDLWCYVRIAGAYPIAKTKIKFAQFEEIAESFITGELMNPQEQIQVGDLNLPQKLKPVESDVEGASEEKIGDDQAQKTKGVEQEQSQDDQEIDNEVDRLISKN